MKLSSFTMLSLPPKLIWMTNYGKAFGEGIPDAKWQARYIPAFIRRYPFLTANLRGASAPGVLIDIAWSGFSRGGGARSTGAVPASRSKYSVSARVGAAVA